MEEKKNSAADYTPIFGFVISYFIFHLFDWQDATYFLFSTLVSLIVFMIELRFIKDDYEVNRKNLKSTGYYTGLLSLVTVFIFIVTILSWSRIISFSLRMALLLFLEVIYIAIIFRAINILISVKSESAKKKITR